MDVFNMVVASLIIALAAWGVLSIIWKKDPAPAPRAAFFPLTSAPTPAPSVLVFCQVADGRRFAPDAQGRFVLVDAGADNAGESKCVCGCVGGPALTCAAFPVPK